MILGLFTEMLHYQYLNETQLGQIWNTLLNNCNSNQKEISIEVADAFVRISPSSHKHFHIPDASQKIMNGFFELSQ